MEPGCTAHMGPIWVPTWDPYGCPYGTHMGAHMGPICVPYRLLAGLLTRKCHKKFILPAGTGLNRCNFLIVLDTTRLRSTFC